MNSTLSDEQKDACLRVLYEGLIAIRVAGWEGDAPRCAQIADALHNLPDLVRDRNSRGWTLQEFVELFLVGRGRTPSARLEAWSAPSDERAPMTPESLHSSSKAARV